MTHSIFELEIYERKKALAEVVVYWMVVILLLIIMLFIFGTVFKTIFLCDKKYILNNSNKYIMKRI